MKKLWIYFFPLLFLPNFGLSQKTIYGVLEVSDWLIVPFALLLLIAPSVKYPQRISKLHILCLAFAWWASVGIITIHIRYDYFDDLPIMLGCLLKLGKLVLYVTVGLLIPTKVVNEEVRRLWNWSLVASLCVLALGLFAYGDTPASDPTGSLDAYKSYNVTIVSISVLASYVIGLWIEKSATRIWNACAALCLLFAAASVLLSTSSESHHGRGGWLAFIVGCAYLLYKKSKSSRAFSLAFLLACLAVGGYLILPNTRSLVDSTLSPASSESDSNVGTGVDDGARLFSWLHEAPKFLNAPLWGTGFYHRGGESGLWDTGSHNFFIQMFLETGIVGGSLVIAIFVVTWRETGSLMARHLGIAVPTRAALITAVVGGFSGEYYYGGLPALLVFSVFALVGIEADGGASVVRLTTSSEINHGELCTQECP